MNRPDLSDSRRFLRAAALAGSLLAAAALTGCGQLLPDPAVRYVAFGDSSTAGPGDTDYWEYLPQDLDLPADAFAGQGRGGETAAEGLPRLRDLLDSGLYPNAEVLLFWEGGGSILQFVRDHDPILVLSPDADDYPFAADLAAALDQVQADIEQAVELAQQANLAVYVATYYPLSPGPCDPALLGILTAPQAARANEYLDLLNERIRQAAADTGAILVDVATRADDFTATFANYADCNHLSAQGNRIAADLFAEAIGGPTN